MLLRADGEPWNEANVNGDYRTDLRRDRQGDGTEPEDQRLSLPAFRHRRQLWRGVPVKIVAVNHNTSVEQIESNYSRHIIDHSDEITRAALLDHAPAPITGNVVKLAG